MPGKQLMGNLAAFLLTIGRNKTMISDGFRNNVLMLSSVVLLTGGMVFAQVQPGGGGGGGQPEGQQPSQGSPTAGSPRGNMPSDMGQNSAAQTMDDKAFVKEALQGGMAEVQLGQLAAQKASSGDVKQFAQKMVDDHTKLGDQMKAVAQQVGVNPPEDLSKKDKQLLAKLQGLSGEEFDKAYIAAMVKDHKKDESAFKSEAQMAQIPAVKQAAAQGAPVIASHLQMIKQIAQAHSIKA